MAKHIVVTGGAKGIGQAIVAELAADKDHKITATYHGSKDSADKMVAELPGVKFVQVDLEDRNAVETFIAELAKGQPVDVLVNNAGLYLGKPFEKMSSAELYEQIDLNFASPTQLIRGLLPMLKKAKAPLIINISSQAVNERISGEAMYTAVKAAVTNLSYVLRAELNPQNIRVTAVEPFGVNTYGIPEPSNMILPGELAKLIRYAVEMPDHLQLDTIGISHIKQSRPDYPDWIEH